MSNVYLIRRADGLHKIGFGNDPRSRAHHLSACHGERVVVHAFATADARRVEQRLHAFFTSRRAFGEWFRLSEDDVRLLCSLVDGLTADDLPPEVLAAPPGPSGPPRWGRSDPDRRSINVRVDDETIARLARLAVTMREAVGVEVSQADVIRAALIELEKRYPPPAPAPPRGRKRA